MKLHDSLNHLCFFIVIFRISAFHIFIPRPRMSSSTSTSSSIIPNRPNKNYRFDASTRNDYEEEDFDTRTPVRVDSTNIATSTTAATFSNTTRVPFATISTLPKPTRHALNNHKNDAERNDTTNKEEMLMPRIHPDHNDTHRAWQYFLETVQELQQQYGNESLRVVDDVEENSDYWDLLTINSLVFQIDHQDKVDNDDHNRDYVLVVLSSDDRVDKMILTTRVQQILHKTNVLVSLAPSHRVEELCGFQPGSIPPLGLLPAPIATIVDSSLANQYQSLVRGGGGVPDQSTVLTIESLLELGVNVHVAAIVATENVNPYRVLSQDAQQIETNQAVDQDTPTRPRPFFPVEPPDDSIVQKILAIQKSHEEHKGETMYDDQQSVPLLEPVEVTVVGRVANVRRMARRLAFCDFFPPSPLEIPSPTSDKLFLPWRSAISGEPMAVQLIAGKTLCLTANDTGEAIGRIQAGQLLMVDGQTSVKTNGSLENWINKRCLDIIVKSFKILQEDATTSRRNSVESRRKLVQRPPPTTIDLEHCLKLSDLYESAIAVNGEPYPTTSIAIVDNMESVKQFATDLSTVMKALRQQHIRELGNTTANTMSALVGIDCEWQPSFMLESARDSQPVLLLQVCIHALKRIYLFDLQTLLRPMEAVSQPMDKLEKEVSFALGSLFESKLLIKVGFQIVQDLRQLAASYPHIESFQFYNSVLESSTVGKKMMRIGKMGNARDITSSLTRLVDFFIGKPLNKAEQCSDWSRRPLTKEQIEYAAIDAAVTPSIVETLLQKLKLNFFEDIPAFGRWRNDRSFEHMLSSWRFVFIQTSNPNFQQKLKAKRVVGELLVVTQSWTTGSRPPTLPFVPEKSEDGPYIDIHGTLKIPSKSLSVVQRGIEDRISSVVGNQVGISKEKCIESLLFGSSSLPTGARLDFPQRSGYIELKDGAALFVNSEQLMTSRRLSIRYPNVWLEEGRVLSWYIRENDWKQGSTSLAKKLLGRTDFDALVVLFLRMENGSFLCCGRCKAREVLSSSSSITKGDVDNWSLVCLHLQLLDWEKLKSRSSFQEIITSCSQGA